MPRAWVWSWWRRAKQLVLTVVGTPSTATTTFTNGTWGVTANGVSTATLTLTVREASGNPMEGVPVTFTVTRTLVSASLSTTTSSPAEIANDGVDSCTSTIQILDSDGNGVQGVPAASCVLAVSGAGNTVTQPTGVSDYTGRISGSWVSTTAATKTVSWTIAGLAITDTDSVVVTSGAPTGLPNEPAGLSLIGEWNDEATLAGSLRTEATPYISKTNTDMGTAVFDGATNINCSNGATPWATAGISVGMMAKFSSTASNNTYYALTAISGQNATTRTTNTSETDASYTLESGWGDKTRVTSGYTGSPTYGGTAAVRTYYPGGVHGGHDAGRLIIDCAGTEEEVYAAVECQFPSGYPTSTSSGGNKHLIVTFSGGSRFLVNFDEGAATGHWSIYGGTTGSADWGTGTEDYLTGVWQLVELYLKKPTTGSSTDGILRLYVDDVLALERTNLQYGGAVGSDFPAGNFSTVYWDGSNNGNHTADHPSGQRYIGDDAGSENTNAVHYMAMLYASGA